MRLLDQLPNILTLINLVLGALGVILLAGGQVDYALFAMAGCLLADVLDGATARWLKVSGPLGVQLDSLADLVSFGMLPAMMLFRMPSPMRDSSFGLILSTGCALLLVASTALRLARFNIDDRPRQFFYGLATPAGAIFISGWFWAQIGGDDLGLGAKDQPWLLPAIPIILALLYQMPLRLPGLKSPDRVRYWLILPVVIAVTGFFWVGPISISFGIIGYVLTGLVNLVVRRY